MEDRDIDVPELARPILRLRVEQLRSIDERVALLERELSWRARAMPKPSG